MNTFGTLDCVRISCFYTRSHLKLKLSGLIHLTTRMSGIRLQSPAVYTQILNLLTNVNSHVTLVWSKYCFAHIFGGLALLNLAAVTICLQLRRTLLWCSLTISYPKRAKAAVTMSSTARQITLSLLFTISYPKTKSVLIKLSSCALYVNVYIIK